MEDADRYQRATFAAGCFWDAEASFRRMNGIVATAVGFTGGKPADPTYEQVSEGSTGHAEAVDIIFDPAVVTCDQLLDAFWNIHDPTRQEEQGDYTGPQYRSAIYYHNDEQKEAALASRKKVQETGRFGNRQIVTELVPATRFWPAEECHQQFYEKCGQGYCISRQADE
ncbi:peptide-methionine (S)-S-oxide reductase MsrA [uncultured Methanoregula sp.]|uniref:peptide-methionine (S)-S-oxide reductase MsrA n=1 Tax=uncultured Methanoregula sp. TaxID=1005933 RepID=UPI002AAA8499|nr:peptide-methionine (S)-S-oxide reductase MsrA [uncultured Methanoregula sp.]